MNDQLSQLFLLPPPISTMWAGTPGQTMHSELQRDGRSALTLELPLFWYDPHWSALSTAHADELAVAVASRNVLVSALRSDLSGASDSPGFHADYSLSSEPEETEPDSIPTAQLASGQYLPRIVPYRPERYGLSPLDFDNATIIDVRMMMTRDASGRFAYSPQQIQRWEATPSSAPLAGGSWVPAATFPPDVSSVQQLNSKLKQLRQLAPSAAVFASIGPYRMESEIPAVVAAKPDALIVRMDEVELDPLQMAALTRRARQLMNDAGAKSIPFWLVPGNVSPDDAVKLVALGADAIGIDSWCNPLIETIEEYAETRRLVPNFTIDQIVDEDLDERLERFTGLYLSLQKIPKAEQLGSFSANWAKTLGVRALR